MKILITGVTDTHVNDPNRASSTKFVSIPELMAKGYKLQGHTVEHRALRVNEDISAFDKVFIYLYPYDKHARHVENGINALNRRPDAYICLDDWAFQHIIPTWKNIIDVGALTERTWVAPLFPWGNAKKMSLPVENILTWDPSPLYEMPPVHQRVWQQRQKAWYNASLSKDSHLWAEEQNLTWPIKSVGGKALGQPRILESDVVWEYGNYIGVLCPTYDHAGCGWWRIRYLHAMAAGCILGGDPKELKAAGGAFSFTLKELESMTTEELKLVASLQAKTFKYAALQDTTNKLESFL